MTARAPYYRGNDSWVVCSVSHPVKRSWPVKTGNDRIEVRSNGVVRVMCGAFKVFESRLDEPMTVSTRRPCLQWPLIPEHRQIMLPLYDMLIEHLEKRNSYFKCERGVWRMVKK